MFSVPDPAEGSEVPRDGGTRLLSNSTTVSLSTAVPRPTERRTDERSRLCFGLPSSPMRPACSN